MRFLVPLQCFQQLVFCSSSRRRHTRSLRDWSSDVCSPILRRTGERERPLHGRAPRVPTDRGGARSEERRVGKEGRSRWAPEHEKKKRDGGGVLWVGGGGGRWEVVGVVGVGVG